MTAHRGQQSGSLRALILSAALLATAAPFARTAQAAAAEVPAAVAAVPVSDRDPGPFPFLPALEGFDPMPAESSNWIKSTDFARYGFQSGESEYVEVGGRLMMRHFTATEPGTQSLDKIVESYRQLVEEKGGVTLFTGLFTGGVVDANPRSEQQAREGATYLVRTPERELWAQVSVRSEGDEYVLVVVEKGPLQLRTRPLYGLLKEDPALALSIEGYTDDRGPAAYNQSLSERRAAAVRSALLARGLGRTPSRA